MYDILISAQFVLGTGIALVLSVIGLFSSENHEKAKVVFFASTAVSALLFIFAGMLNSREQNKANTMFNTKAVIVAINGSEAYVTQDKFHTPMACAAILFRTLDGNLFQVDCASAKTPDMIHITSPQWVYSHNVGDTVYFEHVSRTRFIPGR
jgi:hypothetical protein